MQRLGSMRHAMILCISLLLTGCSREFRQSGGDILIMGDSVMAWNASAEGDVGDVIAARLDRRVINRAALGARLEASGVASLVGLSIPHQLSSGRWQWVVMNGGANDLGNACGCKRCDAKIDALISADGTVGIIPTLIARTRSTGAQVLWMGYYQAPNSASFANCRPDLVELEHRIAIHSRAQDGVYFVDAEDVFDPADQGLLASDRTHPSVRGSAVLGKFLAREILDHSSP